MALTIRARSGYTFTGGEVVTYDKLNALFGDVVFELEGTIAESAIPDGAVTNDKLAMSAVGATDKIANEVITLDKVHKDDRWASVVAEARNLSISNNPTDPTFKVLISADEVVLKNAQGGAYLAESVSVVGNISLGVNLLGLDAGSEAADTWYHIWLISNGTLVSCVFSTSSTAPTLSDPAFSGYVYYARVGVVRNNGSSNFRRFTQWGRQISQETQLLFTASAGTANFTEYAIDGAVIPLIATSISGGVGRTDTLTTADAAIYIASYGDTGGTTAYAGGVYFNFPRFSAAPTAMMGWTAAASFGPLLLHAQRKFYWRVTTNGTGTPNWRVTCDGFSI